MSARLLAAVLVVLVARPWHRRGPRDRGLRRAARRTGLEAQPGLRWLVPAVVGLAAMVVGGLAVGVVAAVGAAAVVPLAVRFERRRSRVVVAAAVPDLVDLFLVAASAGQPVAGALAVVATRAPSPVAAAVMGAQHRFRLGLPLADCLDGLGEQLAPSGVALTDALRQAAATGVPLVPLLTGVAAAARDVRRRRAQEVARRLPVTMLFPLVACILPAAIALAVVPVLLVSVSSLSP